METAHHAGPSGRDYSSDAQIFSAAHDLVATFIEHARFYPGDDILDERVLPASRRALENAFRLAIATEPSARNRRTLMSSGELLANYQPDLKMRISLAPASSRISVESEPSRGNNAIECVLQNVATDSLRLRAFFKAAEDIAKRTCDDTVAPPFSDDGTYTWYGHH